MHYTHIDIEESRRAARKNRLLDRSLCLGNSVGALLFWKCINARPDPDIRELMREFIQRQREAREYEEFLRNKVETARVSMRAGRGRTNEEVEAKFAARRAAVRGSE